jgi:MarR family transcriptional regulator for hemolysin
MERLDPYESLGFHCTLTLKSFVESLGENLKGTGVSPTQFIALAHLVAIGPICQTDLAGRLSITPPSAVRLIDRMERDKWVVRKTSPDDGRVKLVAPTGNAIRIWDELSKAGRAVINKAYQGIHPAEIEMVKRVLERIRFNLK